MENVIYSECPTHHKPNLLLCLNNDCNLQLCLKCVSKHSGHDLIAIEEILENMESFFKMTINNIDQTRQKNSLKYKEFFQKSQESHYSETIEKLSVFARLISEATQNKIKDLETDSLNLKENFSALALELNIKNDVLGTELEGLVNCYEKTKVLIQNSEFLVAYKLFLEKKSIMQKVEFQKKELTILKEPAEKMSAQLIFSKILDDVLDFTNANHDLAEKHREKILKLEDIEKDLIRKKQELEDITKFTSEKQRELENANKTLTDLVNKINSCKHQVDFDFGKWLSEITNTIIKENKQLVNQIQNPIKGMPNQLNAIYDQTLEIKKNILDAKFKDNNYSNEVIEKRFENYQAEMIEWNNPSHIPTPSNCLQFINDQSNSIIAWDGKNSGWILFDFKAPILMVKTKIKSGTGIWEIQYSDDKYNFFKCAEININSQKEAVWPWINGSHRYWRYFLKQNNGSPYYYGYEWYYIGVYNMPIIPIEQPKRFDNYQNHMLEWNNTSHTPTAQNCLQFINNGNAALIAWDGKSSGWLLFDFQWPHLMVKTKLQGGCGIWEIQYSDDKSNFITCFTMNMDLNREAKWDKIVGAHRYWRYNLKTNTGSPYYYGYEWFYIE